LADAHLLGREPEREIAGVMLDQEFDETFVRAERRAMNAKRNGFWVASRVKDQKNRATKSN
jgi:hypothetical protein